MKPAISQVCTLEASLEADFEDYAAGACEAIELWLGKVEGYLEDHSVDDVRRLLDENELVAPVAAYQGGLLTSQGDARREHWNHFARRLQLCNQLGVQTLILACDVHGPLTQQDLDRISMSLGQAAVAAGEKNVRLALEFQAQATFGNNLQTAAALVAECNEPALGLCLDVFHYYCGPSKPDDIGYLSSENLFHIQLSDLAGQPRELASDADRILPGDGDFLLEPLLTSIKECGYRDYVSVELMNPDIWRVPPRQFGEIAMTALRRVLGQASMG